MPTLNQLFTFRNLLSNSTEKSFQPSVDRFNWFGKRKTRIEVRKKENKTCLLMHTATNRCVHSRSSVEIKNFAANKVD